MTPALRRIVSIDALEMVEIGDTQAHESIGVSRDREGFDELGQVDEGPVDVVDLGCALEPKLCECLNSIAELRVVDDGVVTEDDPEVLEPIDPALRRRRRKADLPSDVTCRTAAVLEEKRDDPLVGAVEQSCEARKKFTLYRSPDAKIDHVVEQTNK